MNRHWVIANTFLIATALLALVPLVPIVTDFLAVGRVIDESPKERGYDWITWREDDGLIRAYYVFRSESGLQSGDLFYRLDYRQYFMLEDLQRAIERIPLGSTRTYSVLRGPEMEEIQVDVRFTRYPTFLYPLTPALWHFSVWGFVVGSFFHLIGLVIAVPLARRSRTARFSLLLICVSSLWFMGNLLRMLLVNLAPGIEDGGGADVAWQVLTLLGLVGWIGFPALLLHKVLTGAERLEKIRLGPMRSALYFPALVLGLGAALTTARVGLGPLSLGGLIQPILFYACFYIGVAAASVLLLNVRHGEAAQEVMGGWPRNGSAIMLAFSILMGLSVLGVVPLFGAVTDTIAGWVIVTTQLLSIVPVVLVSLAALKYGKVDRVLSRALTYLSTLGLIFFAFVGGMALAEPYLLQWEISTTVVAGLYVVLLLIVFERVARRLGIYAARFFATDRQQARQELRRFQEHMSSILDFETLVQETMAIVGRSFGIRSGHLFLCPWGPSGGWIDSAFHPEPPYLTERILQMVWPHVRREGAIWARKSELNESSLPEDLGEVLAQRRVSLAVPIPGEASASGLLVLGPRQRRAVYNLEDLDMLRALCAQLSLAMERLRLFERERALIRESAEAQLSALRAQINPHFLFNALNTIIALIEDRSGEAEEAVEHLAAIFRHTLQTGGREFVTIEEELSLVSHFLSIEQARFGARMKIERTIDDSLLSAPVPAFAVQTLVENAIQHGLLKQRQGGAIRLECRKAPDGFVEFIVADTGVGIPALFGRGDITGAEATFFGIGLRNVASRLEKLFGRADLLRMASDPESGTIVRLLLPAARA